MSLVGLSGFALFGRATLAAQLDRWQVLPRPERFSELYFTDYHEPPALLQPGTAQQVTFTVRNLEHRTTTYRYKIIARPEDAGTKQQLGAGTFTLAHDQSRITKRSIVIPPLAGRVQFAVDLDYEGIAFGKNTPSLQTQSIDYWVTLTGAPGDKDQHEVR